MLTGVVIVVIDGDTVLFKPDHYHPSSRAFIKVRLVDIDAPEKEQPYGEAATRALEGMALQQRATLEVVATDVYGRKLGRLGVGALPVNEETGAARLCLVVIAQSAPGDAAAAGRSAPRGHRAVAGSRAYPAVGVAARAASSRSLRLRGVPSGSAMWHSWKIRAVQWRQISLSSRG